MSPPIDESPHLQPRGAWVAALVLGTALTPAGVLLGWLLPRPLDAVVALPLVLLDVGAAHTRVLESPLARVALLVLGIALTWVFYVLLARLLLWRMARRAD